MLKTALVSFVFALALVAACSAVTYTHPIDTGLDERDCFDSSNKTCITRGPHGPPLNSGSDGSAGIRWGCGPCSNVSRWYDRFDTSFNAGCAGGLMPEIVGKPLCLETQSNGQWDVVFGYFQGGGGGGFNYTRASFPEELSGAGDAMADAQDPPSETQDYTLLYIIVAVTLIAALPLMSRFLKYFNTLKL